MQVGALLAPLLPQLGMLLQQLGAGARPPFGLGAAQVEALEERLCYCLGVLAEKWLITLAPRRVASAVLRGAQLATSSSHGGSDRLRAATPEEPPSPWACSQRL